jgi:hypothetical protein
VGKREEKVVGVGRDRRARQAKASLSGPSS